MVTGLVIGLSATFLPTFTEKGKSSRGIVETTDQPESNTHQKRTFDFYTLLPELEVVVDKDKPTPAPTKSKPFSGNYVLQVGSFKNNEDADRLRARLALIGIETNIEIVKVNAAHWHRVRVGPSRDVSQLRAIQNRLRSKDMDSILLKIRG